MPQVALYPYPSNVRQLRPFHIHSLTNPEHSFNHIRRHFQPASLFYNLLHVARLIVVPLIRPYPVNQF